MILIVGSTGDLGGRVTGMMRGDGHEIRCLARAGSHAGRLRELGVEVVTGDLTDAHSLEAACRDVDTVIATATAMGRRLAGSRAATIRAVDEQGMRSLVDAAGAAGVSRFVYTSFAGVDAGIGTPLDRAKLASEKRLADSPMRMVIVRPDAFQEMHFSPMGRFDMASGRAAIIGKGDTNRRWVATHDVAALLTAVTLEADPPRLVEFGGPEPLTKNEAIEIAEKLTGRRMRVRRMPRAGARLAARLLDRRNDALASVFGLGLHQDLREATRDDAPLRERGIVPRSASDFLREQAARVQTPPSTIRR